MGPGSGSMVPGYVQGIPRPPRGRRGRRVGFGILMMNTLGRRRNADCGGQNNRAKPPQSVLIANRLRPQSHPNATLMLPQGSTKATLGEKHKVESRKQKPGPLDSRGLRRSGAPGSRAGQGVETEVGGAARLGVEFEGGVTAVFQEFDAGQGGAEADVERPPERSE